MSDDVLVKCENVSKKFCRSLKRSLWYGVQDICSELNPFRGEQNIFGTDHFPELRQDEFWAVNDISFELRRGECLGLIGHNGAGKSTLLKILYGLIKPDHGKITMKGRIGALIELNAGFNPILTGRENVYIYGSILGFTKKEIDQKYDAIVEFAELQDFMEMPVRSYSSGMKVRLGFAVAAQMEPDVLIIDEVLAVGDIGFVIKSLNRMSEIIPTSAVIFVSHNMPMVARTCNRALLMEHGISDYLGNDVTKALDLYVNKFSIGKRTEQGSQDVKLCRIGLKKTKHDSFHFGDGYVHENGNPMFIILELSILDKSIEKVDVFLKMVDQQLREVLDCLSVADTNSFAPKNGKLFIELYIPNVFLNGGKHTITIGSVHSKTKKVLSRTTNTIAFMCKAYTQGWATSIVPGQWTQLALSGDS